MWPSKFIVLVLGVIVGSASEHVSWAQGADDGNWPRFVLKDCSDLACGRAPQQVGAMKGLVGSGKVITTLTIKDSAGADRTVVLIVTEREILVRRHLVFTSNDCFVSGTPYMEMPYNRLASISSASVVTGSDGTRNGYVSKPGARVENLIVRTEFDPIPPGGGCKSVPDADTASDVIEAELVAYDLQKTFPPPYSLEIVKWRRAQSPMPCAHD